MNQQSIQVGFGRIDFTPQFPVRLAGYGNTHLRVHQGFYNRIYATCIAITDENGKTLLLYTTDQIRCNQSWTDEVRARIEKNHGIPGEQIMLSATHTHSGPDISSMKPEDPYYEVYMNAMTDAAKEALEDRSPAQTYIGRTEIPGLSFVRHYYTAEGDVIGDNYGDPTGRKFVSHTMETDREMQLVRFARQGKKDVLMVNWQAHPTVASTISTESGRLLRPFVGADYIGGCRDFVEKNTDCLFAFFQGAAGNIGSRSRITEETPTTDVHLYGQQLGQHTVNALNGLKAASAGSLQTKRTVYVGKRDHTEDHLVPQAKEICKLWEETNNIYVCRDAGAKYGIHSAYHASSIISRSLAGTECPMELNSIGLGDLSFVTAPYEMFCNNAQYVKQNTPFAMTFVISCSNNGVCYLASDEAFKHGCYEVDNRIFVRGTAEEAADCMLNMLKEIKNEKA